MRHHHPGTPPDCDGRWIHGTLIECVLGNIADQPGLHTIVSSATAGPAGRGHVSSAIRRRAGAEFRDRLMPPTPFPPGSVAIMPAWGLPNRYVIHCRGPNYTTDSDPQATLAACYRQALALAREHGATSIGFPAISTGHNGFPVAEAARIALVAIVESLESRGNLRRVRLVLNSSYSLRCHIDALHEARAPQRNLHETHLDHGHD